jgi:hypothetical protein
VHSCCCCCCRARDGILPIRGVNHGLAAAGSTAAVAVTAAEGNATSLQQQQQQQRLVSDTLGVFEGPPNSRCSAAAQALMHALAVGFQAGNAAVKQQNGSVGLLANSTSLQQEVPMRAHAEERNADRCSSSIQFFAQPGYVDFGFAGTPLTTSPHAANNSSSSSSDADTSSASCEPSCSYTNPSAAYGVTILPLNPWEDLESKVTDPVTQRYEAQNLDGRYGPRQAPSWQLQQDEVVLLMGCTPPAEASRYVSAGLLPLVLPGQCCCCCCCRCHSPNVRRLYC